MACGWHPVARAEVAGALVTLALSPQVRSMASRSCTLTWLAMCHMPHNSDSRTSWRRSQRRHSRRTSPTRCLLSLGPSLSLRLLTASSPPLTAISQALCCSPRALHCPRPPCPQAAFSLGGYGPTEVCLEYLGLEYLGLVGKLKDASLRGQIMDDPWLFSIQLTLACPL